MVNIGFLIGPLATITSRRYEQSLPGQPIECDHVSKAPNYVNLKWEEVVKEQSQQFLTYVETICKVENFIMLVFCFVLLLFS